MVKYVLSLNGGGVKGLFTLQILKHLKPLLKEHDIKFDLIIGTSIGSILGTGWALDLDLEHIFSQEQVNQIFPKTWFNTHWWKWVADYPLYDGQGKRELLDELFGPLEEKHLRTPVLIPTFNLSTNRPKLWDLQTTLTPRSTILHAASSPPVYLPSVEINDELYVDGGVCANHPALWGYLEAKKRWLTEEIKILNIGTGLDQDWTKYKKAKAWGGIKWLENGLLDMIMSAPETLADEQISQLCGTENYLKINGIIPHIELNDTDPHTLKVLQELGEKLWLYSKDKISSFFQITF